jgi:hypothetical protein
VKEGERCHRAHRSDKELQRGQVEEDGTILKFLIENEEVGLK